MVFFPLRQEDKLNLLNGNKLSLEKEGEEPWLLIFCNENKSLWGK